MPLFLKRILFNCIYRASGFQCEAPEIGDFNLHARLTELAHIHALCTKSEPGCMHVVSKHLFMVFSCRHKNCKPGTRPFQTRIRCECYRYFPIKYSLGFRFADHLSYRTARCVGMHFFALPAAYLDM